MFASVRSPPRTVALAGAWHFVLRLRGGGAGEQHPHAVAMDHGPALRDRPVDDGGHPLCLRPETMMSKTEQRALFLRRARPGHPREGEARAADLADGASQRLAFADLKQLCGLTDGNLSRHLAVLQEAGLVEVTKGYEGNRPHTTCRLTKAGRRRFLDYLAGARAAGARRRRGRRQRGAAARPPQHPLDLTLPF